MRSSHFAKLSFVISVALIAFLLGFATRWHRWAPNEVLEQASNQATTLRTYWSERPTPLADRVYDRSGARTVDSSRIQPGLTAITSTWQTKDTWSAGVRLIDRTGQVVHQWSVDKGSLFPDSLDLRWTYPEVRALHGSHVAPNGDLLVNLSRVGTVRLDACGQIQWRLAEGNHHSIAQAHDGTFWIPGTSRRPRQTSTAHPDGYSGLDESVWIERLLHVGENGDLLQNINVLDVLYANDLERYAVKVNQPEAGTDGPGTKDLLHLNDVEPLSPRMADEYPLFDAGDLLVSLREPHLVFVLDPDTKETKWHASAPFIQQHDPDFVGDGWIGVFDNNEDFTERGAMLGGSRIVAMQPHTDSMEIRFPTSASDPFYTDVRGKFQRMPNGNMLLTEAQAGRVVEVDSTGQTVWEWVHPPYDARQVPVVTKATRLNLTRQQVDAWACSSGNTSAVP
ncbi:arylsulfotransferase family protein [Salinibacter ruber]|uniref:arylsulfotransferase family protein n=1 Tax=Salinibacter ruber TaxID=146919 RepID=UPI002168381F|nr:arylsulfotransferase family protein [Salinibacter ruber]MCS4134419.1 hypothetical protein [Salinibacter ruber]